MSMTQKQADAVIGLATMVRYLFAARQTDTTATDLIGMFMKPMIEELKDLGMTVPVEWLER
jgi:hypothetical protein